MALLLIILCQNTFCQITTIPKSFRYKSPNDSIPYLNNIPYSSLEGFNNLSLQKYADSIVSNCAECEGNFYGYGIAGNYNVKSNAQYTKDSIDNGKLWIFKLKSTTAYGFQFYFKKFIIPDSASLFIYNEDKTRVLGPYTKNNTPSDTNVLIHFGTPQIYGNTVYFEYFESKSVSMKGHIEIENTIHLFRTDGGGLHPETGSSLSCEKDITCAEGQGWEKEANSVAAIWYYNPSYNLTGWCTGSLLNNTSQDGTPYFLTAGHCYNSFDPGNNKYNYSTWQFAFRYHSEHCGQQDLSDFYVVYGSQLLSHDGQYLPQNQTTPAQATSDYLLLLLNSSVSELNNAGACYSGWTLNDPTVYPSTSYALIHHPRGDSKKITLGTSIVASTNLNSSHFYNWTTSLGAVEPGSSGAPIYNAFHQIVATVKGAQILVVPANFCNPDHTKINLGKFSWHWSQGNFKQWLDPLNQTNTSTNGVSTFCPYTNPVLGGPTPPYSTLSTQTFNSGFKVDGKVGSTVIVCPSTLLNVTPIANYFLLKTSFESVDCSTIPDCATLLSDQCRCSSFFWSYNCECKYSYYQVYIDELDYTLNPTGVSGTKVYRKYGGYISNININPADMSMSFVPGKFYKIGLGHMGNGNAWRYSSTNVYIMPQSLGVNAQNISTSLYADNSIYLQDVIINNNPQLKIASSDLINVNGNSSLKVGRYYTNSNLSCTNAVFRTFYPTNLSSTNSNYTVHESKTNTFSKKSLEQEAFNIFPNPATSNVFIKISNTELLKAEVTIAVFNSFGIEMYNTTILNETGILNLDITSLNKGIYILNLKTSKKTQNFKFLKE